MTSQSLEIGPLRLTRPLAELSARLGSDPMLVQAGTGNTSIKSSRVMWIKASGKWLADATREDILVPVDFEPIRDAVHQGRLLPAPCASIETAMHAVIPHRVVLHVHAVNTISWAVLADGRSQVAHRLAGLHWEWIPYVASGLPLALAVQEIMACDPRVDTLILANHGLVVCGEDCESAETLLREVEWRLRLPVRAGRAASVQPTRGWRLPACASLHDLGTDPISQAIVTGGVLYPCQGIFLSPDSNGRAPFRAIEGSGVLLREDITAVEEAILFGLVQVAQRIEGPDAVRYLTDEELAPLMTAQSDSYRAMASHASPR